MPSTHTHTHTHTYIYIYTLWPHITLRSLDVRMTAIVPQAVVTDNHLGINSCHAISRLYQATLMSCGTAKHVSVDCTIYILMTVIGREDSHNEKNI